MDLFQAIDQYCERVGPELLSEPLNLITNLAFIVAAVAISRQSREALQAGTWPSPAPRFYRALIITVYAVGIGSASFHSFANGLTHFADVAPISVFLHGGLFFVLRWGIGLSLGRSLLGIVAFGVLTSFFIVAIPKELVNGSNGYFGSLITLMGLGAYFGRRGSPSTGRWFVLAGSCFALSLLFRSVDEAVCATVPFGTHFLWHICNGTVVFLVMSGAREAANLRAQHRA